MNAHQNWKYVLERERHAERRRIRRRQNFFTQIGPTLVPEHLSSQEASDLLFGSLIEAKRVVRNAQRRQVTASVEGCYLPATINNEELPLATRPARILSRLNRSSVFPPLLAEGIEIEGLKVDEILTALRSHQDAPAPSLLDALATASGLSWDLCARILFHQKLVTKPIDENDIAAIQSAREFHNRYGEGRARYAVLSAGGKIEEFQGDWAYFDHDQILELLPGIIVPTKLKRHQYLTNLVANGKCSSIDVYAAPKGVPLFQHPFFDDLNPLFFGKPKSKPDPR